MNDSTFHAFLLGNIYNSVFTTRQSLKGATVDCSLLIRRRHELNSRVRKHQRGSSKLSAEGGAATVERRQYALHYVGLLSVLTLAAYNNLHTADNSGETADLRFIHTHAASCCHVY